MIEEKKVVCEKCGEGPIHYVLAADHSTSIVVCFYGCGSWSADFTAYGSRAFCPYCFLSYCSSFELVTKEVAG
mgnify:CR=1 FL=1